MLLNPEFMYHPDFLEAATSDEVKHHFRVYCATFGKHILGKDATASRKYVSDCCNELAMIMGREGNFDSPVCRDYVKEYRRTPSRWWHLYADRAPKLKHMAIHILGQTCTASACERNWSSYGFVHTQIRNRLRTDTAEKLVFIYHNSRITSMQAKIERRTMREFNKFFRSQGQQQLLKRHFGVEYGAEGNDPADEWVIPRAEDRGFIFEELVTPEEVVERSKFGRKEYVDDLQDEDFGVMEPSSLEVGVEDFSDAADVEPSSRRETCIGKRVRELGEGIVGVDMDDVNVFNHPCGGNALNTRKSSRKKATTNSEETEVDEGQIGTTPLKSSNPSLLLARAPASPSVKISTPSGRPPPSPVVRKQLVDGSPTTRQLRAKQPVDYKPQLDKCKGGARSSALVEEDDD